MANHKINKVLIANRGEIALRIKRACEKLGIATVGIASDVDKTTYFAKQFGELVQIGGAQPHESYLNIEKIINAAKGSGCDAIHPGYGFLSENSEFAARVIAEGLVFIGPSPESIEILGDKTKARKAVQKIKVPCVPGSEGGLSDDALIERASKIGFPIIIKASSGGGGRGMRVVESPQGMKEILPRARAEAKKNFGSPEVFIEKYIRNPRHIEVQLFGDSHGNIIHFGTRDCSAQRRHQKIIEEAPAPNLSPKLRDAIHMAAINAAKSVRYRNAGTAEFLVAGKDFYFLEMNTRIQVEHPVTEEVTGIDLVELQLKIAQGEKLPLTQSKVRFSGHAIEFRVYAENPEGNFAPSIGTIDEISWERQFPWVREERGFASGDEISPYYDAMIAKVIVKGDTRLQALERAYEMLQHYVVRGVKTNIEFERWVLLQPEFRKGSMSIQFIESAFSEAEILKLRVREVRDPKFRAPIGDCEQVEYLQYRSAVFNVAYKIEVLHTPSGIFVIAPISDKGVKPHEKYWRRSNGLEVGVRALIAEVLDHVPPGTIFGSGSG